MARKQPYLKSADVLKVKLRQKFELYMGPFGGPNLEIMINKGSKKSLPPPPKMPKNNVIPT